MSTRPKLAVKRHKGYKCGMTGKIIFKSHEHAVERGMEIMSGSFRAYGCNFCGGFHLTTKV